MKFPELSRRWNPNPPSPLRIVLLRLHPHAHRERLIEVEVLRGVVREREVPARESRSLRPDRDGAVRDRSRGEIPAQIERVPFAGVQDRREHLPLFQLFDRGDALLRAFAPPGRGAFAEGGEGRERSSFHRGGGKEMQNEKCGMERGPPMIWLS